MSLDPKKVPSSLSSLIPIAERWGLSDDYEREKAILNASTQDLIELANCLNNIADSDLYGWLSGSESFNKKPSAEYIAITNLTMAIDSAKLKIRRRSKDSEKSRKGDSHLLLTDWTFRTSE